MNPALSMPANTAGLGGTAAVNPLAALTAGVLQGMGAPTGIPGISPNLFSSNIDASIAAFDASARVQDNNGNQVTGASVFLDNEPLSEAALREHYAFEGWRGFGYRVQNEDAGTDNAFTAQDLLEFRNYRASGAPGNLVLDFYPEVKEAGGNYNSDQINEAGQAAADEAEAAGDTAAAESIRATLDRFNESDDRDTDVLRMNTIMHILDAGAQNYGFELIDTIENPDDLNMDEIAAEVEESRELRAGVRNGTISPQEQIIQNLYYDDVDNDNTPDQLDTLPAAQFMSNVPLAGLPGQGQVAGVTALQPQPMLDLASMVIQAANQLYSQGAVGNGAAAQASFGTFGAPVAPQPAIAQAGGGAFTSLMQNFTSDPTILQMAATIDRMFSPPQPTANNTFLGGTSNLVNNGPLFGSSTLGQFGLPSLQPAGAVGAPAAVGGVAGNGGTAY